MREIKFRAKPVNADYYGEWVEGYYFQDLTNGEIKHYIFNCPVHIEVIPETVGQFTGLFDKNRHAIYEGDFLRIPSKNKWEEINYPFFEIFWHDNDSADKHTGWQFNRIHYNKGSICGYHQLETFLPKYVSRMERIGNIHDNKDLINETT